MSKNWKCKKCGQTFEEKPTKHGRLLVTLFEPAENEPCDGEVVEIKETKK